MRLNALRYLRLVFVALLVSTAAVGLPTSASATPLQDELAFVRDINLLRASKGVPALVVDTRLTSTARNFAATMAATGHIYHNPDLAAQAPADWLRLGENVGVGYDERGLHNAFVNSPGHYRNLVEVEFNAVGIGVVYSGGKTWVVEMFMKSASAPVVAAPVKPELVTSPSERAARYRTALDQHAP